LVENQNVIHLVEYKKSESIATEGALRSSLWSVAEAAKYLGVSPCWVYRHQPELPTVHVGGRVRFDATLLSEKFSCKIFDGKSLKPERGIMPSRYQRGSVVLRGKKTRIWHGVYREDVVNAAGKIERRQKSIRLGTVAELPTKNAARKKLTEMMNAPQPSAVTTFRELSDRWLKAEGPTMKTSTLDHYQNALKAYLLPTFGERDVKRITREEIQLFLSKKAASYSHSSLRSMRVVLSLVLGWGANSQYLERNPCVKIRLPKEAGGRKVTRTVLTGEQVSALVSKLEEPYATLVLFLCSTGLRIGEAVAVKWSDMEGEVLNVTHRIYDGDEGDLKSKSAARSLPLDSGLLERMRKLGNSVYVFCSRAGTPINPGNGMKRYVHPVAKELGIELGGWHDFRHTLTTTLRRAGVHPVTLAGVLGHSKVDLAMNVYDRATLDDFRAPLGDLAGELLTNVSRMASVA
jgi:integrase